MVNFGLLTAEIGWRVCLSQQISMGFASWLRYCTNVAHRWPTKSCTMLGRLLGWYTIYTFRGLLSPDGILPGATSLCIQVLRSPILAALLHGTRAAGVSQTLRHGQGMELQNFRRRRHLLFRSAAITMGIGPHSSCCCCCCCAYNQLFLNTRSSL